MRTLKFINSIKYPYCLGSAMIWEFIIFLFSSAAVCLCVQRGESRKTVCDADETDNRLVPGCLFAEVDVRSLSSASSFTLFRVSELLMRVHKKKFLVWDTLTICTFFAGNLASCLSERVCLWCEHACEKYIRQTTDMENVCTRVASEKTKREATTSLSRSARVH